VVTLPMHSMSARCARFRASTADTDRTVAVLQRSFVEGRLTKDELDLRLGQALVAPFFDQLMEITADLPVGTFGRLPAHPAAPASRRSGRWRVAAGRAALVAGLALILAAAVANLIIA
jgi:hypothetical protein